MDYTDQRNTLIADLNEHADYDVSYLQGLADFDLVTLGLNSNAYSNRKIRAGSNGQSYWIVGCLSAFNGTAKFALYNHFANQLPEEMDRLLCKDLLNLEASDASNIATFWRTKKLSLQVRDALDNSRTSACADVYFEKENGDNVLVATEMCGYEIDIPLMATGKGKYTLHISGDGYVGYTEQIVLEQDDCNSHTNKCAYYATISPATQEDETRIMLSWDGTVSGLDFSLLRVNSNASTSDDACVLTTSGDYSNYCNLQDLTVQNAANILDGSVGGTTYTIKDSKYMSYMLYAALPKTVSETTSVPSTLEEVLEFAGWRTASEVSAMTIAERRSVHKEQYSQVSSVSTDFLDQNDTADLVSAPIVAIFMMKWNVKTVSQMQSMDYTDQQNALVDAFVQRGALLSSLDGLYGKSFVEAGLEYFNDDNINYDSVKLMITNGEESETAYMPEMSEGANYWVIGCLESSNSDFTFVQANLFIESNPADENDRFCYNLFMDAKKD